MTDNQYKSLKSQIAFGFLIIFNLIFMAVSKLEGKEIPIISFIIFFGLLILFLIISETNPKT